MSLVSQIIKISEHEKIVGYKHSSDINDEIWLKSKVNYTRQDLCPIMYIKEEKRGYNIVVPSSLYVQAPSTMHMCKHMCKHIQLARASLHDIQQ